MLPKSEKRSSHKEEDDRNENGEDSEERQSLVVPIIKSEKINRGVG